jgi:putative FmdB family regulatory protein
MPVFDFHCEQCQKDFSELLFGNEAILCPHCGGKNVKKIFSPFYTVSESTRFEANAKDLPSMETWRKAKHQAGKIATKKDPLKALRASNKATSVKPRAGVHHKKSR